MIHSCKNGQGLPATQIWACDPVPMLPFRPCDSTELAILDEVSAPAWLTWPDGVTLFGQTLYQTDGYAMTLL